MAWYGKGMDTIINKYKTETLHVWILNSVLAIDESVVFPFSSRSEDTEDQRT